MSGYNATRSATGTKTDTPLRQVPQSITVVGAEQIRDQGAQSVQDALRYVPGTVADAYGFDSRTAGIFVHKVLGGVDYSHFQASQGTASALDLNGINVYNPV